MNQDLLERQVAALERIADALEHANALSEYEMDGAEPSEDSFQTLG